MSNASLAADLARFPLFAALEQETLENLADRLAPHTVRRSATLFVEGEPGDAVFLVVAGKIKITRSAADGRENLMSVLGPGDVFGELSLFDPGPRTASATAVVDTSLASLGHDDLRFLLRTRPEAAELLLRVLARRLRRTNDAMSDLIFTDVPGRVAKALLSLAGQFGSTVPDGVRVDHALTQEELAQLVGASRETVNKALADFAARGWITLESRSVVLLEPQRLEKRSR